VKWIKTYKTLLVFGVITLIGLSVSFENFYTDEGFVWQDFLASLDTATAIALAVLAVVGYMEYIKSEDEIPIYFEIGEKGRKVDIKLKLLRRNCSRNEVLGVLGMIQKDSKNRFNLANNRMKKLLIDTQKIQKGELNELCIEIDSEEFGQFDIVP